jgi:hypothetical protein
MAPPIPSVHSEPGPRFRFEISLGILGEGLQLYEYDDPESLYDSALYAGGFDLYWTDVSARMISASTNRGRDTFGSTYRPGTATIELIDEDGLFNPDYVGLQIGQLSLRPGRWARLLGRWSEDSEWEVLILGKIDSIEERYIDAGHDARARITITDLLADLARDDPPALATPIRGGELPSDRVAYVLDESGFNPDEWLIADPSDGRFTMLSSTFGDARLVQAQDAELSEGGAFYQDRVGKFRFRAFGWLETAPESSVPQFNIGGPGADVEAIRIGAARWDRSRIRNDVQLARRDGTAQRRVNTESWVLYDRRTYQRFDYENETDEQVGILAQEMIDTYSFDRLKIAELDLVAMNATGVRKLLELELGWRVRVFVEMAQPRGWGYSFDAWVERISHKLIEGGEWITTIRIENTDRGSPVGGGAAFSTAFDPEEFDAAE